MSDSYQEPEELLRQAIEVGQLGYFVHDQRNETLFWSPRMRELHGGRDGKAPTLALFLERVHPDDRARVVASVTRAHDPAGDGRWRAEYRVVDPDGSVRWLVARSQTTFDGAGDARCAVRTVGAVIDVTDSREADEAMRVKDLAMAAALTAIAITDVQGRLIYVNPSYLRMWGHASADDVLGRVPPDLAEPGGGIDAFRQTIATGSFKGELVARRADGSPIEIALSAAAVYDDHGHITHMMSSFLDITESKRLQAQLAQAQKMESIGRLAGGVAHDFNNLLTVIRGNADLVLARLAPDDPVRAELSEVIDAADSAASLTRQLLAFSRKQVIDPQLLDLGEVIARVERMLARLLGEDIVLRVFHHAGTGVVRFDRGQLEQILINLAVNGRDAMRDGGRLTIETGNVTLDEAYVRAHPGVAPGEYVRLAVSDTGVGMTPEARAHLFEPFFTTKGPGQGTGLGLPMVFGAVSQNGGRIEVYSETGHGTTIKIYLPRVFADAERQDAPPAPATRGFERIVLVEDNESVRSFAARVLSAQGYVVDAFASGPDALAAAPTIPGRIDLLLTDVVMPDMNGKALAERLVALRPGLRVLFTSGYTENVVVHHGVLTPGVEFLQKPYTVASLIDRVRGVLDRE